jgi:ribosome-associated translation inhibitor RaiA
MKLPIQITFKNIRSSEALTTHLYEKAAKLDHFHEHIISCRIVLEMTQKHQHQGKLFRARLVFNHHENEDIYVAIRDSFNAAARELKHLH